MPELLTTVLAKGLVVLLEALLARLFLHLMRSVAYRNLAREAIAA